MKTSQSGHVSWPLLILSFLGGWILATILFYATGHEIKGPILALFNKY
jgi:hypothetical protein